MSLERVLKLLETFGLARKDAEVYIYLAKKGPMKEETLADSLRLARKQLYSSLRDLESKGLVTLHTEESAVFSAVAFESVLDVLVKANIEKARAVTETKEEILASWRASLKRGEHSGSVA